MTRPSLDHLIHLALVGWFLWLAFVGPLAAAGLISDLYVFVAVLLFGMVALIVMLVASLREAASPDEGEKDA